MPSLHPFFTSLPYYLSKGLFFQGSILCPSYSFAQAFLILRKQFPACVLCLRPTPPYLSLWFWVISLGPMQTKFSSNYFLQLLIFPLPCKDLTLPIFFFSFLLNWQKMLSHCKYSYIWVLLPRTSWSWLLKLQKNSLTCAMLKRLFLSLTSTSLALLEINVYLLNAE